jgi:hypothetical protein
LSQSFNKIWIVFSFNANQDYIAKVLCVNQDKPQMRCQGKCVLKQRLKAENEKEKKEIPRKLKKQQQVFYFSENFTYRIECTNDWTNKEDQKTFFYQPPFTLAFARGIFRPPKLIIVSIA